jgi:hypothetical protein
MVHAATLVSLSTHSTLSTIGKRIIIAKCSMPPEGDGKGKGKREGEGFAKLL